MRLRVISLALVALAMATASTQAGTVVLNDSGDIGAFMATNLGVNGSGTATIEFDPTNSVSQVSTVNGSFITPELSKVNGPITLFVTPTGAETYNLALSPPTYNQTIGATAGAQAILAFNLQTGVAPTVLPQFFNMSGHVTSLVADLNPNLSYSLFKNGGDINITLTATAITGAPTFAAFLRTPGAVAVGNGSFSQAAIPEPGSVILLGTGIGVVLLGRQLRRLRRAA